MSEGAEQPVCFFCRLEKGPFPCRTDGVLDKERLAETWLEQHRARYGPNADPQRSEELWWAWECLDHLASEEPDIALDMILLALPLLRDDYDKYERDTLAAGPLEDLIARNGERVIRRIEEEAWRDSEFRKLLQGVWSQGNDESDVWQRVLRAREGKKPSWMPTKGKRDAKPGSN